MVFVRDRIEKQIRKIPLQLMATVLAILLAPGSSWSDQAAADIAAKATRHINVAEFLELVERQTGFRIKVQGDVSRKVVNEQVGFESLNDTIAHLVRELKAPNHVAMIDTDRKIARIIIMSDTPNTASATPPTLVSTIVNTPPPANSYETTTPIVLEDELAEIRSDYLSLNTTELGSAEISPPSEFGPGLSRSEFESLKTEYIREREAADGGTVVSPSSEAGDGFSAYELDDIKSTYLMEPRDTFRQISPASEFGPGLTDDELNDLKVKYLSSIDQPVRDSHLVSTHNYHDIGREKLK